MPKKLKTEWSFRNRTENDVVENIRGAFHLRSALPACMRKMVVRAYLLGRHDQAADLRRLADEDSDKAIAILVEHM